MIWNIYEIHEQVKNRRQTIWDNLILEIMPNLPNVGSIIECTKQPSYSIWQNPHQNLMVVVPFITN